MKPIKVVSVFDGYAGARYALEKANIPVGEYHAFEIDKYAMEVAKYNYPDIQYHGSVVGANFEKFKDVDLLIGGSPCQGFSRSGKGLNFDDSRSKLFFEFVRAIEEIRPRKFMLENVKMKQEWSDIISQHLGVMPVMINSNLVSAQNRKRLYWANWNINQPEDRNINWGAIREESAPICHYYSDKGLAWIDRHSKRTGKVLKIWSNDEKCQMLEASMYKNYSSQRFFGINDIHGLRYMSLLECERAQSLPDNYTKIPKMSNTQRYKMLGNGFETATVAHILSSMSHN